MWTGSVTAGGRRKKARLAGLMVTALVAVAPLGPGAEAAGGPYTVTTDDAEVDVRGYYADTLRATVLDSSNQPAAGVPVEFEEHRGNGLPNRRLCEGVTDSNGVVTCADNPNYETYNVWSAAPEVVATAADTQILAYVKGGAFEHDFAVGRLRPVPHGL